MRRTIQPLFPRGIAPRSNPRRRRNRTYPLPFYEHETITQTPYGESLTLPAEPAEPLEVSSVLYILPQVENPIGPTVMGLPPQDYGAAIGEVVPVLGQPYREAEVAQQGLPVGEIQPAVEQNIPVQGSIVEAGPCAGGAPVPNPPTFPQLPYTIALPGGPSGPSGGPGGSGGYGVPSGPGGSGSGNIVPFLGHILLWIFILQLLLILTDFTLEKIKKRCEDYVDIREKLRQSEETSKKPVKRPFPFRPPWTDIVMDLIVGIIIALFAPELAQRLIQNISNRWTKAILTILLPVTKLAGAIGLLVSLGLTYMTAMRWLVQRINPHLDKFVWNALRTSSSADGRIMFASLWLKCLLAALLSGVVFRVITQYNKKEDYIENLGLIFVSGWGLIFLYNDVAYCQQVAQRLLDIPVGAFFLNSQLGRWSLVVGGTRLLLVFDQGPLTLVFYSLFLYGFRVLAFATTATPNLI